MFDLSIPWWEFIIRAVIIYAALLVLVRISGHRTIGQFTPFDLIVVLLLSESVSSSLNGGDESIIGGLIAATTLLALNAGVAILTSHSTGMAKLFDGHPVLIGRDGKFFPEILKKCRLADADVEEALREQDKKREEMKFAFLEIDGHITIVTK